MRDYEKEVEVAEESGDAQVLSTELVAWETEGQVVTGEVLEVSEFKDSKFDSTCQKYVLQTGEGRASFILGAATDKRLSQKVEVGQLMQVKYRGKRDLGEGRRVNLFHVVVIPRAAVQQAAKKMRPKS